MWSWRALRQRFTAPPAHRFDSSVTQRPLASLLSLAMSDTGVTCTRQQALSVPAIQRARNMLASIATLPLVQTDAAGRLVDNPLFRDLDPDVTNVVTLAQTVEDLLMDGISWWLITSTDFAGFPVTVRHLDVSSVSLTPPNRTVIPTTPAPLPSGWDPRDAVVYVDGQEVAASRLIRFDSPNPAILQHCGRTVRRCIALERAAELYAKDPRPADYFSPAEGAEEPSDDDIDDFLADWQAARRKRATAYKPRWAEYNTVDAPTPQELQLVELQRHAWVEVAQMLGVDAEDLSVSTTSRTYFNAVDRKQSKVNDVLGPYLRCIEQTLSKGNVTRRGHLVSFDLVDYLKPDPAGRIAYYEGLKRLGAITTEEIRDKEGLGPMPAGAEDSAPVPDGTPEPRSAPDANVAGSDLDRRPAHTFDAARLTFADVPVREFAVDVESRTISGVIMPYGEVANKYGLKLRFAKGSLEWTDPVRVKLNTHHDVIDTVGYAAKLKPSGPDLFAQFKVAPGPKGDQALSDADNHVLDGFSVGVDFDLQADTTPDPRDRSVTLVRRATLSHVALTPEPAFANARVTRVVASLTEGNEMSDTDEQPQAVPAEQVPAPVPAPEPAANAAPATVTLAREERPTFVNPVRPTAVTLTRDPVSYRFDRKGTLHPAAHDFGLDIIEASKAGMAQNLDNAAYRRVMEFMRAQFADDPIVNADVNELNPTLNLPRYIDEKSFTYPLWSRLGRGAPPNGIQPFQWPAFSTSGITIQDFTEGTEPELDDYQTTSQSVTPTPKAAKASIPRTVWDMGGTPGIGNLIFQKMTRAWYEAAEAVIDAALDAVTPTSLATLTATKGTDGGQTLASQIETGLALLHFVRGGFRFDFVATQADLFAALAGVVDDVGRRLYPMIAPQNANGTTSSRYGMINVGGVDFVPSWAAAAAGQTTAASSYLLDSTAVDAWVSPPQRLEFQSQVKTIEIAAWGYMAAAVNDLAGVREISWDPA